MIRGYQTLQGGLRREGGGRVEASIFRPQFSTQPGSVQGGNQCKAPAGMERVHQPAKRPTAVIYAEFPVGTSRLASNKVSRVVRSFSFLMVAKSEALNIEFVRHSESVE